MALKMVTHDINGEPMGPLPQWPMVDATQEAIYIVWGTEEDGAAIFDRLAFDRYGHDAYAEATAILVGEGFQGWWEHDDMR